ncbi:hypothetical protein QCA50_001616 [Cerrena zonata]|uniref:Uncharacterized protein n=1 Tax=Cerrena zonata TaxID=2478898 RepID=A0AAW0GTL9_9APHY
MRFFRRKEIPWEVVGTKYVDPVPMYDEDEVLDVVRVSRTDTSIKFMHDIYEMSDIRRAIQTARLLLLQRIQQDRYNTLLSEGWQITVLRKGNKHRVEVTYTGRAAYISAKPKSRSAPPFLDVLEFYRRDICVM